MGGTGPRSREIRLRAPPPHARPRSPFLCQAFPGDRSPSPCPRCQRPPPWRRLHKDATDLSLDFHLIRSSGLVDGKHLYFAQTSQDSVGATRECPVIRTHGPRLPVKYLSGSQEPRHVGEHRRGRRGSHTPRPPPHVPAFPDYSPAPEHHTSPLLGLDRFLGPDSLPSYFPPVPSPTEPSR